MKPISSLMMVIVFVVSLLGGNPQPVQSAPPPPDAIQTLQALSGGQAVIDRNPETGLVRFIGTDQGHAVALQSSPSASRTSADAAMQFARDYGALFGVSSPDADLQVEKAETSADGQTFVRYQQTYQGIPVLGAELIVQLDGAQRLLSMSGEALDGIQVTTTPAVDAQTARQTALEMTAKAYGMPVEGLQAGEPSLWVYNPRLLDDPSIPLTGLVWRTEVTAAGLEPVRELVLVDAQRGGVRLHFNQVDTFLNRTIYDNNNDWTLGLPGNGPVRVESDLVDTGIPDVDYAFHFAGETYDYYFNNFGRDSIDNAGMELISTVRYCPSISFCHYANAFWNGAQMVYGDGFADADDVVGHELTHGVTERTAGLFYYMQSGAINEGLSDIFGEFVDQLNNTRGTDTDLKKWLMGEDLVGYPNGIRNMKDPTSINPKDPDRITSPYYVGGGWVNDYGGVHSNSGILNKAAYLLADGEGVTFNGQTFTAIGPDKTAQIFYRMQTSLLWSSSDYNDVFNLLPQACNSLVGTGIPVITSADCAQVVKAVTATEMNLTNTASEPVTVTSACPAGNIRSSLFSEGFEGTLANWTLTGGAWGIPPADFNYANSGLHELAADDRPIVIVSAVASAAMNAGVSVPSGAGKTTYLHFAHAFDLDSFGSGPSGTYYDGGVVEYSENGTNWFAMDALPVVNGPNATLETGFGNPLAGRAAFSGVSHGYQETRYKLTTLSGKNVRFRWRLGVDSEVGVLGWFLDDVNVYSCAIPLTQKIYLPNIRK